MHETSPIELLFGGMEKLGPGSNADTLKVLNMLPKRPYEVIVDAGCGAGRQSLVLAQQLQTRVHAVDSHEPFLTGFLQRAKAAGMENLIQTHCMDIADISNAFREVDLLWSEGAAYNIGFPHALRTWYRAVKTEGIVVVSELSWLHEQVPAQVREFFRSCYADMRSTNENCSIIQDAGYDLLDMYTLPNSAWIADYYDVLEPRAKALLNHADESVRVLAAETLEEIRIFGCAEDSYGYVFYIMQKV